MGTVLYNANGGEIEVSGGSVAPADIKGVVKNVFDVSQNTEENVYVEYARAFFHGLNRYWGSAGSFEGAHFSYLIPVSPGDKYYLQNINQAEPNKEASAIFYTADKELTTQSYTLAAMGNYITVPATAAYMRVPVHADTVDTVMVLTGTENPIDVYIPYEGQIVPNLYGDISDHGVAFSRLAANAKYHRFKGAKVGCLGDSLTAMGNRWQSRLKKLMDFGSITNYGVSGTTVTSARGEGEHTFRDRAPNMSDDLDLIIVLTSINDNGTAYGVFNEQQGTGTKADATDKTANDVSTIAGAGLELITILRNKYPHKDIVFFSHPHTHWVWSFGAADMYRDVCGRHSVPFFDLLRYSGMDGTFDTDKTKYFTDGVHLTDAGNDRLADYMAACLRTL